MALSTATRHRDVICEMMLVKPRLSIELSDLIREGRAEREKKNRGRKKRADRADWFITYQIC